MYQNAKFFALVHSSVARRNYPVNTFPHRTSTAPQTLPSEIQPCLTDQRPGTWVWQLRKLPPSRRVTAGAVGEGQDLF